MGSSTLSETDAPALRKLCCHHLKKCGGTSFNAWLDTQYPVYPDDLRAKQKQIFGEQSEEGSPYMNHRAKVRRFASSIFENRDLTHTHLGLVCRAPAGAFRMTMLRNAQDRLLSQVRDYRRLSAQSMATANPIALRAIKDAKAMPLRAFLIKHSDQVQGHHMYFDNYMVRALAYNRLGLLAERVEDVQQILPVALDVLEQDMDFVGILEQGTANNAVLASALDWMPVTYVPVLNQTSRALLDADEVQDAQDVINRLTAQDALLYEAATDLFDAARAKYPTRQKDEYENGPLQRRFAAINHHAGHQVVGLDLAQPFVATGHDGRVQIPDGRYCIYVRFGTAFETYIQTPAQVGFTLKLDMGWRPNDSVIENLKFAVNGTACAFDADIDAETLTVSVPPQPREFCLLSISLADQNLEEPRGLQIFGATIIQQS
ncbi:hypothetical protein SAMN04488005_1843 [Yoonia tamlensis]|uniref:Uncharacterized protein n=1 Tax=Yoonia tamlensis TaxID=390270 RepID=A0A1I6GLC8_9RHOB|nr:hypothetical protein [Yoonia tamlensis]SFR42956.1 hypothetical protein SAMN04488005_1843 [Yoonia tamlensis]